MRTVLITVGSTRFDSLVQYALSSPVLVALAQRGLTNLVLQYGNSEWRQSVEEWQQDGINISSYTFKPSLKDDVERADLVISHAGSGTIIDTLRVNKPLIVVPNDSLMDDHQSELAIALSKQGYLTTCPPELLAETIVQLDFEGQAEFPEFNGAAFRDFLDEEMGFI